MIKNKIKNRWKKLNDNPKTAMYAGYVKKVTVVAIIGIILYQLYDIGWREVLQSLPTQPLYYLIFVLMYVTLPTAEVIIYKQLWTFKAWEGFKTFISKKVYNNEVMGYSGELYLFVWGSKLEGNKEREVLKNVRDNNILSAITSNLVAVILLGVLFYSGQVKVFNLVENVNWIYVVVGVVIAGMIGFLLVQFRKYLFDLAFKKAAIIFLIYLFRFILHYGLMVLSWAVVIPETPISIWFTFLTTVIVVNRIPLIPSKDLLFVWFGIELSRMFDMATASVAGMLLVYSALTKVTSVVLYSLINLHADKNNLGEIKKPDSIFSLGEETDSEEQE